jgi:hypothetical protein
MELQECSRVAIPKRDKRESPNEKLLSSFPPFLLNILAT